jgi:hypothetical protein
VIRLTWRQFRAQAYLAAGALVIVAAVVAVTGVRLAHLYGSILMTHCGRMGCAGAADVLNNGFFYLRRGLGAAVLIVPALIGLFWGAPLAARDLETGTYRLAWTQSVTRRRWLAVKLAVPGLAAMAAAGLFGLMASWWARPYNLATQFVGGRFAPGQFEIQGIVPAGYAAFAFAAAVAAGVLLRRTLPAMAAGLAVFAGARLAIREWVRPHLIAPVQLSLPLTYGGGIGFRGASRGGFTVMPPGPPLPGAWVYSIRTVDKAGHAPTQRFLHRACPDSGLPPATAGGQDHCLQHLAAKLHGLFIYQPAGRYWLFQACETVIFTGLALLFGLFCLWWIGRVGSGGRRQLALGSSVRTLPAGPRIVPGRLLGHRPAKPAGPAARPQEPRRRMRGRLPAGRAGASVIRLAWRQYRTHAYVALAVLVITAVVAAVTGPRLAHLYDTTVAVCNPPGALRCPGLPDAVSSDFGHLGQAMAALVLIVPPLIGLFWGAPLLARELETGTFRLAWTQSVTRQRWLAARLAVPGLAAITAGGLLGLITGWWAGPHNLVGEGRFAPGNFAAQGIVPAGYVAFAFAAAVTAGLLIRRTVPAMAASLAAFAGTRYAIQRWVRPHYAAPLHLSVPLTYNDGPLITPARGGLTITIKSPNLPNAWIYGIRAVDKTGHAPTLHFLQHACPSLLGYGHVPTVQKKIQQSGGINGCISTLTAKFHGRVTYQPASRYWLFQAYETAIFAGLAALLVLFCIWWIRRLT